MVVQDLTAAEYTRMALDLLVHADDALMARDYDSISPTLWSAVEHAIAAAAVEHGWDPPLSDEKAELFAIVARIEEERGEDLTDYYDSASMHYDNTRYTFLEDSEHEFFAPSARQFITKLLKLYGWNIRKGGMRKVSHDSEFGQLMDSAEHARIALAWLTVSDEEFAEGRRMQASEKLWGATAHALTAVAMERGWRYGRHRDFVLTTRRLAEESGDDTMVRDFDRARKFHANFYQGQLGDAETERSRPRVHQFVRKVLDAPN